MSIQSKKARIVISFMLLIVTLTVVTFKSAVAQEVFTHAVIDLPFEFWAEGEDGVPDYRIQKDWVRVFQTQEEWDLFYKEPFPDGFTAPSELRDPPQLDFENNTVIVGGTGFNTSGHSIAVSSVVNTPTVAYIDFFVVSPGRNCITTAQVTWPTIAILIPKAEGSMFFHKRDAVFDCEPLPME